MKSSPHVHMVSDSVWQIDESQKPGMNTHARIVASKALIDQMEPGVFDQITDVARLPGIVGYAYCMPDGHFGYGFPIGGVAAFDEQDGVISPGGIGFDINCGMRLVATNLTEEEMRPHLRTIVDKLFAAIPSGTGGGGSLDVNRGQIAELMSEGAGYCVKKGWGTQQDLDRTEEYGCFTGADPQSVSDRAIERGLSQIGSLGSGNHYLEIQVVRPEHVFDTEAAQTFGVTIPNQVTIMLHCGSRGLGHQVASDYIARFKKVSAGTNQSKDGTPVLAHARFQSEEGQTYFSAMKCAANVAFANRQAILHRIRQVFSDVFHKDPRDLGMRQVYDVCHNIAKLEDHVVKGETRRLLVHRKGAVRALGPDASELPEDYRSIGQPVIIGGSMESGSYLLLGRREARTTFHSTAHGSGRVLSRKQARKKFKGKEVLARMEKNGVVVRSAGIAGLAEEAGPAYKNMEEVVDAVVRAGINSRVARFTPIGNIKG